MPNSVGSRHDVAFIAEVTHGTTPATPSLVALNYDGFDLNRKVSNFEDTTIRSDGNVTDVYQGNYTVEGQLSQPLRPTEADTLWESLLRGTWTTNVLKNGTTRKSITMERAFQDNTLFQSFTGVVATGLKLSIGNNSMVKAVWALQGLTATVPSGTTIDAGSGYTAASALTPFIEGSATVFTEGGSTIAYLTDFSLDIQNGSKALSALGASNPSEVLGDQTMVKGTAKAYFPSAALYTKFLNNTSSTFQIAMTSGANSLTILLPKIRYTNVAVPVNGTGPVEQEIAFTAVYDSTEAASIKVTRV
ncbi:phage tail tube protein [Leptothrix discophora]|uniref:Phage tail tube protein n=1 Tax=Leptothrix discophora TaxID=89 RepID=A0ABT9G159_LEPDI|nr:phage tail tube protein [Leptothrix discophora]MDP4299928.1 phage tail tube protein [Leptothrix discophora]